MGDKTRPPIYLGKGSKMGKYSSLSFLAKEEFVSNRVIIVRVTSLT